MGYWIGFREQVGIEFKTMLVPALSRDDNRPQRDQLVPPRPARLLTAACLRSGQSYSHTTRSVSGYQKRRREGA